MSAGVVVSVTATSSRFAADLSCGFRRETGTPAMISSSASASTMGAAGFGSFSVNSLKNVGVTSSTPLMRREFVGGHQRAVVVERGEFVEAFLAQQREVDREGEDAEAGVGADVAGRLFAADVLFAGRERQHVAAAAFDVGGFAAEAARHLADEFLARGEEADIGAAEVQRVADRLALAHHDVGAHFAGRRDGAERDDLGHHGDEQRAFGVGRVRQRRQVADRAVEVRVLDDEARRSCRRARFRCLRRFRGRRIPPSCARFRRNADAGSARGRCACGW